MRGPGFGSLAVRTKLCRTDIQLFSQPVGHKTEPRQRTERDSNSQSVRRSLTAARVDERHISRDEREEPEQFLATVSGNPRRRSSSSSANTRVATNPSSDTPTNLIGSQANRQPPRPADRTAK